MVPIDIFQISWIARFRARQQVSLVNFYCKLTVSTYQIKGNIVFFTCLSQYQNFLYHSYHILSVPPFLSDFLSELFGTRWPILSVRFKYGINLSLSLFSTLSVSLLVVYLLLLLSFLLSPYSSLQSKLCQNCLLSEDLRFDSPWGLRIFFLSHARDKTKEHLSLSQNSLTRLYSFSSAQF